MPGGDARHADVRRHRLSIATPRIVNVGNVGHERMIRGVSFTSIPVVSLRAVSSEWMSDVLAERLRKAREDAGFDSAADAARNFGWKAAAYRHHENGTRNFGIEEAKKYGRAFRINPLSLLGLEKFIDGKAEASEAPQPYVPSSDALADVLAVVLRVDAADPVKRAELRIAARGVSAGIRWLAKEPARQDDPDYLAMVRTAVAEAIESASLETSQG